MESLESILRKSNARYPFQGGNGFYDALEIVQFLNHYMKREKFSPARILETYGKRNAWQIIESREINFKGSCIDYSTALIELMRERGFEGLMFRAFAYSGLTYRTWFDLAFCVAFECERGSYNINMGAHRCFVTKECGKKNPLLDKPASEINLMEKGAADYIEDGSLLSFKFAKLKYGVILANMFGGKPSQEPMPISIKEGDGRIALFRRK